eukprot:CAMPEP_0179015228 /NCGR_PEP_ID=MMETSP0796-20121207/2679_1 /TAXON_ID=73915 /ORGANISM="Pyrodinium bahamense, Strain pbaha01" /LENGTH=95 /DNA_ID=CAMNT_0020710847 /DNA_START=53 /DNA_END=338 /DNA_ORIENTATION=+
MRASHWSMAHEQKWSTRGVLSGQVIHMWAQLLDEHLKKSMSAVHGAQALRRPVEVACKRLYTAECCMSKTSVTRCGHLACTLQDVARHMQTDDED